MKLYKYRSLDDKSRRWTEEILLKSSLFFAKPSSFNDPFEFLTCFDTKGDRSEVQKYLEITGSAVLDLIKEYNNDKFFEYLNPILEKKDGLGWATTMGKLKDKWGVLCLSGTPGNINMWSNYGDEHRGVCFEFESTESGDMFDSVRKVKYVAEPPVVNIIREYIDDELRRDISSKIVYHKFLGSWDHEDEYRVLGEPGAINFLPQSLKAIYLGCRFNLADNFIKLLREHRPDVDVVLLTTDARTYSLSEKFRCKPHEISATE